MVDRGAFVYNRWRTLHVSIVYQPKPHEVGTFLEVVVAAMLVRWRKAALFLELVHQNTLLRIVGHVESVLLRSRHGRILSNIEII